MAFKAGSIEGDITLDESPAVRAMRNTEKEAGVFKNRISSEMDVAARNGQNSVKGMLGDIKSQFGKSSLFGQIPKLLMGGGAIAGISLAGRAISGFLDSVVRDDAAVQASLKNLERLEAHFKDVAAAVKEANKELSLSRDRVNSALGKLTLANLPAGPQHEAEGRRQVYQSDLDNAKKGFDDRIGNKYTEALAAQQAQDVWVSTLKNSLQGTIDAIGQEPNDTKRTFLMDEARKTRIELENNVTVQDELRGKAIALEKSYNQQLGELMLERQIIEQTYIKNEENAREEARAKLKEEAAKNLKDAISRAADYKPQMDRLPNPRVKGEEVFGRRTVSSADLPQGYQETVESAKQTAKNTADIALATKTLADSQRAGPPAPLIIDPP